MPTEAGNLISLKKLQTQLHEYNIQGSCGQINAQEIQENVVMTHSVLLFINLALGFLLQK